MSGFVCLDLSPERVCGLEIVQGRAVRWFTRGLPPGTLPGGAPAEPGRLGAQLRAALDEAGVTAWRARVAITDAALLTRVVLLPAMPGRDLRRAAAFAVERAIPIPATEAAWAWSSRRAAGGQRALHVVAGWKDVVETLRQAIAAAGLGLEVLEPRSAALAALLPEEPTLLLERRGGRVYATALAPGLSPYTGDSPVPASEAGWPAVLEGLVMSSRRHLGNSGRELNILAADDLRLVLPQALGARAISALLGPAGIAIPAGMEIDSYLGALGLAVRRRHAPPILAGDHAWRRVMRRRVHTGAASWVPALAAVSIVSWSAVAAGTALLLGWHPSWPLAP